MAEISRWHTLAKEIIDKGNRAAGKVYLPGKEPVILDKRWLVGPQLAVGDVADLYLAGQRHLGHAYGFGGTGPPLIVKAARYTKDNDLLLAEQRNLKLVRTKMENRSSIWLACIPKVHDSILIGGSLQRRVNIIDHFPGFLTVKEIKERGTKIDGRTLTWMWKRLLVLIDWTYRSGVIHGALLPSHIMFYPDNGHGGKPRDPRQHAVRLIDWCYSIEHDTRSKLKSWVPEYKDLYAPEILSKAPLGPTTDMYMAARTLLWMAGIEVNPPQTKSAIPLEIEYSLRKCIHSDPSQRPKNAGDHFEAFLKIQEQIYGKPQWHEFIVPGGPNL